MRSILIPIDFSEQSRHALRWAAAFAARFGSRLTVLSVVDPLLAEAARVRLGRDLAKQDTEPSLREFVAATLPNLGAASLQPEFRSATGDPATFILETANAEEVDLIVMGTHGLGGLRKWLLGSTTERLLRRATVPVLAVPLADESRAAPDSAGHVLHILAAIDFSDPSVCAARMAGRLAHTFSAKLTLTHIVEAVAIPPQWLPLIKESDETRIATARTELRTLAEQISDTRERDEVVAVGRPADLIGSIAEDRGAQLIVMGLASHHGAFSPRPGSIAYRVLSSTTIPVLVVPASHD